MSPQELIAALESNAERTRKPVAITYDGIGTLYVRRRTVAEFESMADLKPEIGADGKPMKTEQFGPALAHLLCDEEGNRFDAETTKVLAKLLSSQPDELFHRIVEASNGGPKPKEDEAGKSASAKNS